MEFGYSTDPLDPEEEERKRTAALSALAAAGGNASPEPIPDREAPIALPEQVSPPDHAVELGTLEINAPTPEPPLRDPDELPAPEDERKFRAAEALAAQAEPAKSLESTERSPEMKEAAPASSPTTPTAQSPVSEAKTEREPPAQQDPLEALMLRGEEMRRKQLEEYDKRGAPGVNGWALLADVAFNHGRSIPGILQQADAEKQRFEEGRRKLMTGGAHTDPVNQMLALRRVEATEGALGERGKTRERLEKKDETAAEQAKKDVDAARAFYKKNGVSEEDLALLDGVSPKQLGALRTVLDQKYKLANKDEINAAAGEKVASQTHAKNETNATDAPLLATAAGAVRGAQVDEEIRALPTKPQTPDQIAADKLQREGLEESKRRTAAAEGARADAATARKEDKARTWITEYGNKHTKQIDTASLVDELDDVIAAADRDKRLPPGLGVEQLKEGADKYPLGQTLRGIAGLVGDDEYNRFQSEADFNRKLLNRLAESVYRIDTGASGNEREEMRAAIASATNPLATLDDIKNSMKILRARLTSQLGNAAAAAPDLAAQSLLGGNIRDPKRWLGHLQPNAASADSAGTEGSIDDVHDPGKAKRPNRAASGGTPDRPSNLGVNNSVPKAVDLADWEDYEEL